MLAPVLDGTNTIGGTIETGNIGGKMSAVTLENVSVWLMNNSDTNPVALSYSDVDGNYLFENVPNGNYSIKVDITGLFMDSVYSITVEGNNNLLNLDYSVSETSIFIYDVVTQLNNATVLDFKAYPVPFSDRINVLIDDNSFINSIQLKDVNGKIILSETSTTSFNKNISINTEFIAQGVYFLELNGPKGNAIKKIVK